MQVPQDDRDRRILGCHSRCVVVKGEVLFVLAAVTVTVVVVAVGWLLLVGCEEGV